MNDSHHAASIHTSNCITLRSDLLQMVEILKIAYVTSWNFRIMHWIKNIEEIGLYISKTGAGNLMP
jgi:hypothetical protein